LRGDRIFRLFPENAEGCIMALIWLIDYFSDQSHVNIPLKQTLNALLYPPSKGDYFPIKRRVYIKKVS